MAVVATKFYGGTLPTSPATYTVATGKIAVVTAIRIKNKTGAAATCSITIGGVEFFIAEPITAGQLLMFGPLELREVLVATETIVVSAGTASAIDLRISGMVI